MTGVLVAQHGGAHMHRVGRSGGFGGGIDQSATGTPFALFQCTDLPPRAVLPPREESSAWYWVRAGHVGVLSSDHDSHRRNLLVAVLGPGDQYIDVPAGEGGRVQLRAFSAATIGEMSASALMGQVRASPEVATHVLATLGRQLRQTDAALDDLIFMDVAGRVAKRVLLLAERFGAQKNGRADWVSHGLTQQDLADLTGCTREAVNKTMGRFCARGWLEMADRSFRVLEWPRLQRRAGLVESVPAT